jgi:WD40 repeat protein
MVVPESHVYVGPRPFEQEDESIFFGRDRETRDLLSLVIAHNLALVYAQSGAGKTSLINAGLIPRLKEHQFKVFPVARVKGTILANTKTDKISNIYVFNTLTNWVKDEYDAERLTKMKLVDFLNEQELLQDEDGMPLPRAVIFDQFEEIFSSYQDRWKDREGFFEQVSDAMEADPLLRVVFVMREDFIAQLDPYADLLPDRLRTRFHIERLRREAALLAIKEPVKKDGRSFAEGVAEKLVDDLLKIKVETAPGKTADVTGEFIEAVQLQVVCQSLWQGLTPDEKQITFKHLDKYANVEDVLYKFYEEAIRAAAEKAHIDEKDLRTLCGEVLITTMGTRGMVYQAPESTGGIPNSSIDVLESMHLIRAESRSGARWYELTHDRFIEPILSSNKKYNEERAEKERVEKERAEKERLEKEWAEKERAEKERRRSRIIKGLTAFSIIVLILTGFAVYQWYQAEQEKQQAHILNLNLNSTILQGDAKTIDKSVLLAIESFRIRRTLDADKLIHQGLLLIPHSVVVLNHNDSVNNVMFSPDGKYAGTAIADNTARIWDADTGKIVFDPLKHNGSVNNVVFSLDGKYIATASSDNTSKIWYAVTGKEVFVLKHNDKVNNVVFSPDGKYVATASNDSTARVWNADTGKEVFVLNHNDKVNNVVFSPDGKYVATASNDKTAHLWDAFTESDVLNHENIVYNASFTPDGKYVATASKDNTSRIWDAFTGKQIFVLKHDNIVNNVVFSPDGRYVSTASNDKKASIWDAATGKQIFNMTHKDWVYNVVFSPDGKYVATASRDYNASVWNASTGKQIFNLTHKDKVYNVAFSPDGKYVATASADKNASLWSASTGKQIFNLTHDDRVRTVVFSPDGKYIATASDDSTARIWDAVTGKEIFVLSHSQTVNNVMFSPDGKYVATASFDRTASLWDADTGELIFVLKHDYWVRNAVFSPDGKYIVTASDDKTARLWDADTGEEITVMNHDDVVNNVAFSPDGKYVATASFDNTTRLWTCNTEDLINEAGNRLTRNLTPEEWEKYMGDEPYNKTFPNLP